MANSLKFLKKINGYDYYEYTPTIRKPFYYNLEKISLRKRARFFLEVLEGYKVYYMLQKKEVIGYCVVAQGGGFRFKFTEKRDIIVGPYFISPSKRGQGKSIHLLNAVLKELNFDYLKAYDYIHESNVASRRTTENVGFEFFSKAYIKRYSRRIKLSENSNNEFLIYRYKNC